MSYFGLPLDKDHATSITVRVIDRVERIADLILTDLQVRDVTWNSGWFLLGYRR